MQACYLCKFSRHNEALLSNIQNMGGTATLLEETASNSSEKIMWPGFCFMYGSTFGRNSLVLGFVKMCYFNLEIIALF